MFVCSYVKKWAVEKLSLSQIIDWLEPKGLLARAGTYEGFFPWRR